MKVTPYILHMASCASSSSVLSTSSLLETVWGPLSSYNQSSVSERAYTWGSAHALAAARFTPVRNDSFIFFPFLSTYYFLTHWPVNKEFTSPGHVVHLKSQ